MEMEYEHSGSVYPEYIYIQLYLYTHDYLVHSNFNLSVLVPIPFSCLHWSGKKNADQNEKA